MKENFTQLFQQTRQHGWFKAVLAEFANSPEMLRSLLDWQRTSWLSLLGLGPDSVALVVGAGYGLITHSLAKALGKVYSVEALPEQIEFMRMRLEQEGISNAHLVQSSPHCLPFPDRSFDLIVVDGLPEDVGAWQPTKGLEPVGNQFLSRVYRLLKDVGVLVILSTNRFGGDGWANRFGWTRSGAIASSRKGQVRTRRQYRRLLATHAFEAVRFYWPDPDFTDIYTLVPLENFCLRYHLNERLCEAPRFSLAWSRQWIKNLLSRIGLVDLFAKSLLILAWKKPAPLLAAGLREHLTSIEYVGQTDARALPEFRKLYESVATLRTGALSPRSVIRMVSPTGPYPGLILKASTHTQASRQFVEAEYRYLSFVHARLRGKVNTTFSVPTPIGHFDIGSTYYSMESLAEGLPLSILCSMQSRRLRFQFFRQELPRCIEIATEISTLLLDEPSAPRLSPSAPGLLDMLADMADKVPEFNRLLQLAELRRGWSYHEDEGCVQHGDFTIENILRRPLTGELIVIDWADLVRGAPRLYDVFTLLLSVVPWVDAEGSTSGKPESPSERQFLAAFFGRGRWAELFRALLRIACEQMSLEESTVWDRFICFLALRIEHYFFRIDSSVRKHPVFLHPMARECANYLALALQQRSCFIMEKLSQDSKPTGRGSVLMSASRLIG